MIPRNAACVEFSFERLRTGCEPFIRTRHWWVRSAIPATLLLALGCQSRLPGAETTAPPLPEPSVPPGYTTIPPAPAPHSRQTLTQTPAVSRGSPVRRHITPTAL